MTMLWIEFRHPRQTHGNAAPLAMFVVWINNNNNIKPTVFVWYSTPPKTIYLGCFLSLLVVLNHKSGVWHHLRPGILGHLGPGMFDCFCISFCFESQGLPSVPPGTRTRGYWLTSRIRIGHLWVARLRFKMHFPPFKCQISFYTISISISRQFRSLFKFCFHLRWPRPFNWARVRHWDTGGDNCQSGSWVLTQFCLHCLAQFCSQSVTNRCVLYVTVFNVL